MSKSCKNLIINEQVNYVAVNKPTAMHCYPLKESESNTLLHEVAKIYPEVIANFLSQKEGGLCHRLDYYTSGVVIFARNMKFYQYLRALFKAKLVKKTYIALVEGIVDEEFITDLPIAHHSSKKHKMIALKPGYRHFRGKAKVAQTFIKPLKVVESNTWVQATTNSGRRHQIRVHLAAAGYPLVGDILYGAEKKAVDRSEGFILHGNCVEFDNVKINSEILF